MSHIQDDDPWAVAAETQEKGGRNRLVDETKSLSLNEKNATNSSSGSTVPQRKMKDESKPDGGSSRMTFGADMQSPYSPGGGFVAPLPSAGFGRPKKNPFDGKANNSHAAALLDCPSGRITKSELRYRSDFDDPDKNTFRSGSDKYSPAMNDLRQGAESRSRTTNSGFASFGGISDTFESLKLKDDRRGEAGRGGGGSANDREAAGVGFDRGSPGSRFTAGRGRGKSAGFSVDSAGQKSGSMRQNLNKEHADNPKGSSFSDGSTDAKSAAAIERDRAFWSQAATRQQPFVPAPVPPGRLGAFGRGRPIVGRDRGGGDSAVGTSFDSSKFIPQGDASSSRSPQMQDGLAASGRRISQEAGGDRPLWESHADADKPMKAEEISLLNKILHRKLQEVQQGVQVSALQLQSDPSSPLYSANTFESLRLKDELLKALHKMGFLMPSKIQEAALPLLLIEPPQNMIAQSQSGTGKTAAFVLTMLSRVVPENKWPQCLCLAPTYELAMQIGEVAKKMSEFMPDIKIRYAVRGEQIARGDQVTEQIIIGTPGKMMDWVLKLKVIDPSKIICLVFDEADVMISQQGHKDQSIRLHNELERSGAKYQSLLFSATYDDEVFAFAESIIKDSVLITVRREEQTLSNIKQYYVRCSNREEKYQAVVNLYGGLTIASAIIFCYTRKSAEWLASKMAQRGHEVALLHGELPIEERARVIQEFKDGTYKVLITTNVCARGIDVSQVTIVINYDPPVTFSDNPQPDYETYLHRIGRTGRFGKAGIAINFITDQYEKSLIESIEEHFGKKIELLDASDMDQLEAIENDHHF